MSRRSTMRPLVSTALAAALLLAGCAAEPGPASDQDVVPFGLGGKADALCPADAELCWDQDDAATMRALLRSQDDVLLGADSKYALRSVIDLARGLDHKLTDEERAAIDTLEPVVDSLADQDIDGAASALAQLQQRALSRVIGTYYAANMVPVGQVLDSGGKFDDGSAMDPGQTDGDVVMGLTDGMKESLRLIRESGAFGVVTAEMYKMTGVLDRDYDLVNAVNFGEFDAVTGQIIPSGLSREAKVARIISKYRKAAAWVGAGAGVIGLVPIAGIPLSISGETIATFKLDAQMSFEIAAVQGWDIREGTNLFTMSMMMTTNGLIGEIGDGLVSNVLLPAIAEKILTKLGIAISPDAAAKIANDAINLLIGFLSEKAVEVTGELIAEVVAEGIARQLVGWATLGVTVLVHAGRNYLTTDILARHVRTVSKRWLLDLPMEGTTYLAESAARDCAMRALAAAAWQDDDVNDAEKGLFMAFLAKPYNADGEQWFHLESSEKVRHAAMLVQWRQDDSTGAVDDCLRREFKGIDVDHRTSLLGHLHAMTHIDRAQTTAEHNFYAQVRNRLDGAGWFDGEAIDTVTMDHIEKTIEATIDPSDLLLSEEFDKAAASLSVADILPYIGEPDAATKADFDCGFAGTC